MDFKAQLLATNAFCIQSQKSLKHLPTSELQMLSMILCPQCLLCIVLASSQLNECTVVQ